jgi:hypothetical protein
MRRLLLPALCFALLSSAGCGDATSPSEEVAEVTPCDLSNECDEGQVCRDEACTAAPECNGIEGCGDYENCIEGFCAFDPEVCIADGECDDGAICDDSHCRIGCRSSAHCDEETELCSDDLECVRRPCPDLACDEGHECFEPTGECFLRPCDGGCEEPLLCDLEKDVCVQCLEHETCDVGESCNDEGECVALPCENHEECPEGTFCIGTFCLPPPDCEDDDLEPNDRYGDANLFSEGLYENLVSCPYNDDFYQVVADGDHSLTVNLAFEHADGDVNLELFNTVSVLFARRMSETDDEELTVNIFKTGVYTIRVYQEDGGIGGAPYEMTISTGGSVEVEPDICVPDGFEPNNTSDDAASMFTGRWTGMSMCEDDEDYFAIEALAGELLTVCLAPSELFGIQLGLEVLYEDGEVLLEGAGATEFCLEDDLLESDDYRAHVFAVDDSDFTAYHLTFEIDPGCRLYDDQYDNDGLNNRIPREGEDPLVALEPDTPTELHVCPDNSDYWPIDVELGDLLTATMDLVHEDGDLQMQLYRPSGTVRVASVGTSDRETINYEAEQTGIYFIRIYGEGDAMGAYTFEFSITPASE